MAKKDNLTEELKKHFGFDTFKGNQRAIIENVLAGNDTFGCRPEEENLCVINCLLL